MSLYTNLDIEMLRNHITSYDLAECLGKSYNTIRDKLTKPNRLLLDEALKINSEKFPDLKFEYLFHREANERKSA